MPTVFLTDANDAPFPVQLPNPNGRADAADSRSFALATEDKTVLDGILAALSSATPARLVFAIAPSDSAEIAPLPKALSIGGAGNIVIHAIDRGAPVTIAVTAGQLLPVRAQYVRATGTTATGIVGFA